MRPREKKKSASSGVNIKGILLGIYVLTYVAVMLYGAIVWRYAPIRERNGQYVDKRGEVYSAADYRRFVLWERVAFTMGFGGVVVLVAGAVAVKFLKPRREESGAGGGSP